VQGACCACVQRVAEQAVPGYASGLDRRCDAGRHCYEELPCSSACCMRCCLNHACQRLPSAAAPRRSRRAPGAPARAPGRARAAAVPRARVRRAAQAVHRGRRGRHVSGPHPRGAAVPAVRGHVSDPGAAVALDAGVRLRPCRMWAAGVLCTEAVLCVPGGALPCRVAARAAAGRIAPCRKLLGGVGAASG